MTNRKLAQAVAADFAELRQVWASSSTIGERFSHGPQSTRMPALANIDQAMLIATTPIGQLTLSALADTVTSAQRNDPFGRVVVVADHSDVAAAVRHLLGARGVINVTVQAGQRLAAELAGPVFRAPGDTDAPGTTPPLRPLNRLGESQAVRRIADDWLESAGLRLSQMGRRRLYAELTDAFRQREQRPTEDVADTESPDDTGLNLPRLYDEYRALLDREGYYTRHQLPGLAAKAL